MSDLLIKGLDLPKDGDYDYNLTIRCDGKVEGSQQMEDGIHRIHTWATELPEHGRLIDVDAFIDSEKGRIVSVHEADATSIRELYERIDNAQTVLEASE